MRTKRLRLLNGAKTLFKRRRVPRRIGRVYRLVRRRRRRR